MHTIRDIWIALDLFGEFTTFRDYMAIIDGLILIGFIIFIVVDGLRHSKLRWSFVIICFWLAILYGATLGSTASYKIIQKEIALAEDYEEKGDLMSAYNIYYQIYKDWGNYQDVEERMDRLMSEIIGSAVEDVMDEMTK